MTQGVRKGKCTLTSIVEKHVTASAASNWGFEIYYI